MSSTFDDWTPLEKQFLSPEQISICEMKATGKTIKEIKIRHNVNEQQQLSAICYTMRGLQWNPHVEIGGTFPYLGPMDVLSFKLEIESNCVNLDCLRTIDGIELAYEIKKERFRRGLQIAYWCSRNQRLCEKVLKTLDSMSPAELPSFQWLNGFCNNNGILIKNGERLEDARRRFCNVQTVTRFFQKHGQLIARTNPRLLWNIDETSSQISRRYKVLVNEGTHFFPTSVEKDFNHVTAILPFNANGDRLEPFVILPNISFLPPELKEFDVFFTSQKSGWMSKRLFLIFCTWFTSRINNYRQNNLTDSMFDERVILLMDNHPSRLNPLALQFFAKHNISVITFPPHCTHLMQPFDVSVARSFKSYMQIIKFDQKTLNKIKQFQTKIAQARYKLLYLIVHAWNSVSKDTLIEGFKAPGFIPYDPTKCLQKDLCNKTVVLIAENRRNVQRFGCECLTNDDIIVAIYNKVEKKNLTSVDQMEKVEYSNLLFGLLGVYCMDGFALSKFPPLIIRNGPNIYSRVLF